MKISGQGAKKLATLGLALLTAGTLGATARMAWAAGTCCSGCYRPDGTFVRSICVYNCGTCDTCGNCCVWGINCQQW